MSKKIGRNDPCPCGSGKKYKHCHLKKGADGGRAQRLQPSDAPERRPNLGAGGDFRFNPGAYGRPEFGFVPALMSEKWVSGSWQPHFLLANPARPFDLWTQAAELAVHDLESAFAAKDAGGDEAAGRRLESLGYKSVENFKLEEFRSLDAGLGFDAGPEDSDFDDLGDQALGEGAAADDDSPRATFLQVVDEQIRSGEPAETALTFKRLLQGGHSEAEAKELIAILVAAEIFAVTKEGRAFNEKLYVKNLRRLPKLPKELRG